MHLYDTQNAYYAVVDVISTISTFFFFSSRRRHTRWPRDWSSDVCSSDLGAPCAWRRVTASWPVRCSPNAGTPATPPIPMRSEERRVGKECRSQRSKYHSKQKTS